MSISHLTHGFEISDSNTVSTLYLSSWRIIHGSERALWMNQHRDSWTGIKTMPIYRHYALHRYRVCNWSRCWCLTGDDETGAASTRSHAAAVWSPCHHRMMCIATTHGECQDVCAAVAEQKCGTAVDAATIRNISLREALVGMRVAATHTHQCCQWNRPAFLPLASMPHSGLVVP